MRKATFDILVGICGHNQVWKIYELHNIPILVRIAGLLLLREHSPLYDFAFQTLPEQHDPSAFSLHFGRTDETVTLYVYQVKIHQMPMYILEQSVYIAAYVE
jgi:hypothetical protein